MFEAIMEINIKDTSSTIKRKSSCIVVMIFFFIPYKMTITLFCVCGTIKTIYKTVFKHHLIRRWEGRRCRLKPEISAVC